MAVAVVDRGGQPLALLRDNLAGSHTRQTAIGKAATAVSFRTDTTELAAHDAGRTAAERHPRAAGRGRHRWRHRRFAPRARWSAASACPARRAATPTTSARKPGIAAISDALELE